LPGAYKQVSEDWVGELKAQVAPDDYQSAVDRQKGRDIKELIREVLQNAEGEVVKDKV
jgi:citrate lyase gamma subunit